MSIKITIKSNINDKLVKNYVLFCDENFKIFGLSKLSLNKQSEIINRTINLNNSKKKDILYFNINPSQKILLIRIKKSKSFVYFEKQGAKFYDFIKSNTIFNVSLFDKNIQEISKKNKYFLDEFIHGIKLKSYKFLKYKSKKDNEVFNINISSNNSLNFNKNKRFDSIVEGVNFTKDLVSEPGNVLHPDEYAKRLKQLTNMV